MPKLIGCPLKPGFTKRDCATQRGPELGCPVSCTHNPFTLANINDLQAVQALVAKRLQETVDTYGKRAMVLLMETCEADLKDIPKGFVPRPILIPWLYHTIFQKSGVGDQYKAGKHDEAVLAQYIRKASLYLVSVGRVSEGTMRVYDTLGSEQWDATAPSMNLQGQETLLFMASPMMDHLHIHSMGWVLDPTAAPGLVLWVREQARRHDLTGQELLMRRFPAAVGAYYRALNKVNPDMHPCACTYSLQADITEVLAASPDLYPVGKDYLLTSPIQPVTQGHSVGYFQKDIGTGRYPLGVVSLTTQPGQVVYAAATQAAYTQGRAILDALFKDRAVYSGATTLDIESLLEKLLEYPAQNLQTIGSSHDLAQLPATYRDQAAKTIQEEIVENTLRLATGHIPAMGGTLTDIVKTDPHHAVDLLRLHWIKTIDILGWELAHTTMSRLVTAIGLPPNHHRDIFGS